MSTDRKAGRRREYQGRYAGAALASVVFLVSYPVFMYLVFPDASVHWFWPEFLAAAVFVFVGFVNFIGIIGYTLGIGGSKDSQHGPDESEGQ